MPINPDELTNTQTGGPVDSGDPTLKKPVTNIKPPAQNSGSLPDTEKYFQEFQNKVKQQPPAQNTQQPVPNAQPSNVQQASQKPQEPAQYANVDDNYVRKVYDWAASKGRVTNSYDEFKNKWFANEQMSKQLYDKLDASSKSEPLPFNLGDYNTFVKSSSYKKPFTEANKQYVMKSLQDLGGSLQDHMNSAIDYVADLPTSLQKAGDSIVGGLNDLKSNPVQNDRTSEDVLNGYDVRTDYSGVREQEALKTFGLTDEFKPETIQNEISNLTSQNNDYKSFLSMAADWKKNKSNWDQSKLDEYSKLYNRYNTEAIKSGANGIDMDPEKFVNSQIEKNNSIILQKQSALSGKKLADEDVDTNLDPQLVDMVRAKRDDPDYEKSRLDLINQNKYTEDDINRAEQKVSLEQEAMRGAKRLYADQSAALDIDGFYAEKAARDEKAAKAYLLHQAAYSGAIQNSLKKEANDLQSARFDAAKDEISLAVMNIKEKYKGQVDAILKGNPKAKEMYDAFSSATINDPGNKDEIQRLYKQSLSQIPEINKIIDAQSKEIERAQQSIIDKHQKLSDDEQIKLARQYSDKFQDQEKRFISRIYDPVVLDKTSLDRWSTSVKKEIDDTGMEFAEKKRFIKSEWNKYLKYVNANEPETIKRLEKPGALRAAEREFYFSGFGDMFVDKDGKPSVYAIKSQAEQGIEQAKERLKILKAQAGDAAGRDFEEGKGAFQNSWREMENTSKAIQLMETILAHPESDHGFWSDLNRGLTSKDFIEYVPFVGTINSIADGLVMKRTADRLADGKELRPSEQMLLNSLATQKEINKLKPTTTGYNVGVGIAETLPAIGEFALTSNVFSVTKNAVKNQIVSQIEKNLVKSFEKKIASGTIEGNAASLAKDRVKDITTKGVSKYAIDGLAGFAGVFSQTAANPQQVVDKLVSRMTPQVAAMYTDDGNKISAQIESRGEDWDEALVKAFGQTYSEMLTERLGGHVVKNGEAAVKKLAGNPEWFKRSLIGSWMAKRGISDPDAAYKTIIREKLGWNGILEENIEEHLNHGLDALITGDHPVTMDGQQALETFIMTGLLGAGMKAPSTVSKTANSIITNIKDQGSTTAAAYEYKDPDGNLKQAVIKMPTPKWKDYQDLANSPKIDPDKVERFIQSLDLTERDADILRADYAARNHEKAKASLDKMKAAEPKVQAPEKRDHPYGYSEFTETPEVSSQNPIKEMPVEVLSIAESNPVENKEQSSSSSSKESTPEQLYDADKYLSDERVRIAENTQISPEEKQQSIEKVNEMITNVRSKAASSPAKSKSKKTVKPQEQNPPSAEEVRMDIEDQVKSESDAILKAQDVISSPVFNQEEMSKMSNPFRDRTIAELESGEPDKIESAIDGITPTNSDEIQKKISAMSQELGLGEPSKSAAIKDVYEKYMNTNPQANNEKFFDASEKADRVLSEDFIAKKKAAEQEVIAKKQAEQIAQDEQRKAITKAVANGTISETEGPHVGNQIRKPAAKTLKLTPAQRVIANEAGIEAERDKNTLARLYAVLDSPQNEKTILSDDVRSEQPFMSALNRILPEKAKNQAGLNLRKNLLNRWEEKRKPSESSTTEKSNIANTKAKEKIKKTPTNKESKLIENFQKRSKSLRLEAMTAPKPVKKAVDAIAAAMSNIANIKSPKEIGANTKIDGEFYGLYVKNALKSGEINQSDADFLNKLRDELEDQINQILDVRANPDLVPVKLYMPDVAGYSTHVPNPKSRIKPAIHAWSPGEEVEFLKKFPTVAHLIKHYSNRAGLLTTFRKSKKAGLPKGSYDTKQRFVSLIDKGRNNLDVFSHEFGHHVDTLFGLSDKSMIANNDKLSEEIADMASRVNIRPEFQDSSTTQEAWAEFIRSSALNNPTTSTEFPEMSKLYNSAVSQEMRSFISELGSDVVRMNSLDIMTKGVINTSMDGKSAPTLKAAVTFPDRSTFIGRSNIWFMKHFMDESYPLKMAMRQLEAMTGRELSPEESFDTLVNLFNGVNQKTNGFLKYGFRTAKLDTIIDDKTKQPVNLEWIMGKGQIDAVTENELNEIHNNVVAYMLAKRTVELSNNDYARQVLELEEEMSERKSEARSEKEKNEIDKQYAEELNSVIRKTTGLTGIGTGLEESELDVANKIIYKVESEYKQSNPRLHDDIMELTRRYRVASDAILKYAVDSGRLSQEEYNNVKKSNSEYVALKRVQDLGTSLHEEDEGTFGMSQLTIRSKKDVTKKIKGSRKTVINPYVGLLDNIHNIIKESDRNHLMSTAVNIFEEAKTIDKSLSDFMIKEDGDTTVPKDVNAFTIYRNGKEEKWWFSDPMIQNVFEELSVSRKPDILVRVLSFIPSIIRTVTTSTPTFALRNFIRDWQDRFLYSKSNNPGGFNDFKSGVQELSAAGGAQSGYYSTEDYYRVQKEVTRDLLKSNRKTKGYILNPRLAATGILQEGFGLKTLARGYSKSILRNSEMRNRVAEYNNAFKKYNAMYFEKFRAQEIQGRQGLGKDTELSPSEIELIRKRAEYNAMLSAGLDSRQLLDFAITGKTMRTINRIIPFSNAGAQGIRRFYKAIQDKNSLTKMIIYSMAVEFLFKSIQDSMGDSDEWEEQPEYLKDAFWGIKVADNTWLRIPKPYESSIFGNLGRRIWDYSSGNDEFALDGSWIFSSIASKTPFAAAYGGRGLLENSTLDLYRLYDSFRGRDVVPDKDSGAKLSERSNYGKEYGNWTSNRVMELGASLGLSTDHLDARAVDYAQRTMLGEWGDAGNKLINYFMEQEKGKQPDVGMTKFTAASPGKYSRSMNVVHEYQDEYQMDNMKYKDQIAYAPEMKIEQDLTKELYAAKTNEEADSINERLRNLGKAVRSEYKRREDEYDQVNPEKMSPADRDKSVRAIQNILSKLRK